MNAPTKTTTRAEKALPRATAQYQTHGDGSCWTASNYLCGLHPEKSHPLDRPVAVIPCRTRAQAARIARVANMAGGERVTLARDAYFGVTNNPTDPDAMVAVLSALGLATGGKA